MAVTLQGLSTKKHIFYFATLLLIWLPVAFLAGCGSQQKQATVQEIEPTAPTVDASLSQIHYTIQAGAFKNLDNAVRYTDSLQKRGIDAFFFLHESGFYKVRFGNYNSFSAAQSRALALKNRHVIDDYYIVQPDSYQPGDVASEINKRDQLLITARRFIGIPYKWGGTSVEEGFDCSGLAMVVYKLNGFNLPRTSAQQFQTGRKVTTRTMKPGDLVFFATGRSSRVSHVGIYAGRGRFIHAPRRGKNIKVASLDSDYFSRRFIGARSYL